MGIKDPYPPKSPYDHRSLVDGLCKRSFEGWGRNGRYNSSGKSRGSSKCGIGVATTPAGQQP